MNWRTKLRANLINIPGWSTKRKIVVIESDDWGSIRMSSKKDRDNLIKLGFDLVKSHYNMYDALESNSDMEALYDVLSKYKDKTKRSPVLTAVSIVANPDFEKIKDDNFMKYHYEPFSTTLTRYPNHEKVIQHYREGLEKRLFYPVFHGREHLNVIRWMRVLQKCQTSVIQTFNHRVTGISRGVNGEFLGDFQAAFDLDFATDIEYQKEVIKSGLNLFKEQHSFNAEYFVATNGPFNNKLEKTLYENGIKYMLAERKQNEPLGDGKYKQNFRYIGMKNSFDQIYLTRNVMFEPGCFDKSLNIQPVENCLKAIERAFSWNKPAVISSHRVNYIGFIDEKNRTQNLKYLDQLLKAIIEKWPDVEFLTSVELGNLISTK